MLEEINFHEVGESSNQFLKEFGDTGISLFIKREDLLHPEIPGNKFRKLKYNFQAALEQKEQQILTFGGAFSNHISATAAAGKLAGIKTIGIIRGEELAHDLDKTLAFNSTLKFASSCGMKLHFISRTDYRKKENPGFIEGLRRKFGKFYLIPEGGNNELAVKACEEILTKTDKDYKFICCPVGTGGTISGIINSSYEHQQILGFPALKGDFLASEIQKNTRRNNWELILKYHFGGYAKMNQDLIEFINNFKLHHEIQLDPVYTGKMLYGVCDLIENNYFPENSRILAIHTGGIQGIEGMNKKLSSSNLPIIKI